jgi:chemotaxis protein histidine kinase CheA
MSEMMIHHEVGALFAEEAAAHLDRLDAVLLALEQADCAAHHPGFERAVQTLHTFAGAARSMELTDLAHLAQALEAVFAVARARGHALSGEQCALLHRGLDLARALAALATSLRLRQQTWMLIGELERCSRAPTAG